MRRAFVLQFCGAALASFLAAEEFADAGDGRKRIPPFVSLNATLV